MIQYMLIDGNNVVNWTYKHGLLYNENYQILFAYNKIVKLIIMKL